MSKRIEYLHDYEAEAALRRTTFGKTDKHSTGFGGLDSYLGYGFGNRHGYEIVTIFGESGIGKSMFALNILAHEMVVGTKIGLMILEDDMPDVYNRILQITGPIGMEAIKSNRNVDVLPKEMLEKPWRFEDVLRWIEGKHEQRGVQLFLVDHIQFIFENEEVIKGENEIVRQRKFMQQLNFLVRRLKITVVLISHTSKDSSATGMNAIFGTTAIKQVSTKVLGVSLGEGAELVVQMYKSRFTRRQDNPWRMKRIGLKLEEYAVQPLGLPVGSGEKRPKGKKG